MNGGGSFPILGALVSVTYTASQRFYSAHRHSQTHATRETLRRLCLATNAVTPCVHHYRVLLIDSTLPHSDCHICTRARKQCTTRVYQRLLKSVRFHWLWYSKYSILVTPRTVENKGPLGLICKMLEQTWCFILLLYTYGVCYSNVLHWLTFNPCHGRLVLLKYIRT